MSNLIGRLEVDDKAGYSIAVIISAELDKKYLTDASLGEIRRTGVIPQSASMTNYGEDGYVLWYYEKGNGYSLYNVKVDSKGRFTFPKVEDPHKTMGFDENLAQFFNNLKRAKGNYIIVPDEISEILTS